MAEAYLDTLLEVKQEDLTNDIKECCICLEEIEVKPVDTSSERPVRLPCTHILHTICITKWLSSNQGHNTCPMCRHTLFAVAKPLPTAEAARRHLHPFYGTSQLPQRGINGEPNLDNEAQNFIDGLNPAHRQLTTPHQLSQRRPPLPANATEPPSTTTQQVRMLHHRNVVEVSTYRHLRRTHPHMPRLRSSHALAPSNVDAMYTALSAMAVFDELWGPETPTRHGQGPSRRAMFALMRDAGYAYQWRDGDPCNCWRRCGWRGTGRFGDLGARARVGAVVEGELVLGWETGGWGGGLGEGWGEGLGGSGSMLVGWMLRDAGFCPARRTLGWWRRRLEGFRD